MVSTEPVFYTICVRAVRAFAGFWFGDDHGQDLADYCLLTALVALIGLGIFIHLSGGLQNLWNFGNSTLVTGNSVATGTTGSATDATSSRMH
jgi:hypothetical protein